MQSSSSVFQSASYHLSTPTQPSNEKLRAHTPAEHIDKRACAFFRAGFTISFQKSVSQFHYINVAKHAFKFAKLMKTVKI